MTDIVKRLRKHTYHGPRTAKLIQDAADEIERLREELLRFANFVEDAPRIDYGDDRVLSWIGVNVERARRLARIEHKSI